MVHPNTIAEYERLGIKEQYDETAHDRVLKDKREITKHDKNPKTQITDVYRVRVANDEGTQQEFIIWQQDIIAKTDIDNYHRWHEDANDTSIYYTPLVEKSIRLNPETEQQETFTNQVLGTESHYLYAFNKENIDMLKKKVNLATRYMVKDVSGFTRTVNNFVDWSTKPFDELIAGAQRPTSALKT